MKPVCLMLDEMVPEIKQILQEFVEIKYPRDDSDYDNGFSFVYTGLTPIVTNAPVFCPCTGVEHIDSPEVIHLDDEFKKEYSLGVSSTAEHTISLILQLCKLHKMQIMDKKLAIVGYGRIGKMVHKMLSGFDVQITIYDINDDWQNEIGNHDIITLHIPANHATNKIINKEVISRMKKTALLVNTSRHQLVDEPELILALKQNRLLGYAHDFNPICEMDTKKRYDLWFNSNVNYKIIATNHIGGNCMEARKITDAYITRKILQYIKVL